MIQCIVAAMNLQETVLMQLRDLILRGAFEQPSGYGAAEA